VDTVIPKKNGEVLRIGQIVNRQDLKFLGPLHHGPENQPPDAAKAIDPDFHCHRENSWERTHPGNSLAAARRAARRPSSANFLFSSQLPYCRQ
jgi:hypothetical protein